MSDKKEGGFFSNLKNQLITGAGVVLTTIGTMFVDEVKSFVGIGDDEEVQTEQVDVKQENNQSVNVTGPTIVVNIPEQKEKVVTKTIIVKPKVKKNNRAEIQKRYQEKKKLEKELDTKHKYFGGEEAARDNERGKIE